MTPNRLPRGTARAAAFLLCCSITMALQAGAQTVTIDAILNNASYALPGLPNSAIAQGSVFVLFGKSLASDALWQASEFPLRTSTPAGTSVRVTVAGQTCDALPVYTTAKQVGAILPSNCPAGSGTVTLTNAGQSSAPAPVVVARSSFGIFAVNQQGTGAAIAQNFRSESEQPLNSSERPAVAGQVVILWGTGLGPIASADSGPPPVGNLPAGVKVWVGGRQAQVLYAGCSGCCAGIDQISFRVPEGIESCHVPVAVEVDGITSNFTSIAAAAPGKPCSLSLWPDVLTPREGMRYGEILMYASTLLSEHDSTTLSVEAMFLRLPATASSSATPPPGSCTVASGPTDDVGSDESLPDPLEAGQIKVSGPMNGTLTRIGPGHYYDSDSVNVDGFPPGTYTFESAGGADVQPFQTSVSVGAPITWTNHAEFSGAVARDREVKVSWTTSDNAGWMVIKGGSVITAPGVGVGAEFLCLAPAAAGEFTLPIFVLRSLPASKRAGYLSLTREVVNSFVAVGLDTGQLIFAERARAESVRFE